VVIIFYENGLVRRIDKPELAANILKDTGLGPSTGRRVNTRFNGKLGVRRNVCREIDL
jgi:hypothetical protein